MTESPDPHTPKLLPSLSAPASVHLRIRSLLILVLRVRCHDLMSCLSGLTVLPISQAPPLLCLGRRRLGTITIQKCHGSVVFKPRMDLFRHGGGCCVGADDRSLVVIVGSSCRRHWRNGAGSCAYLASLSQGRGSGPVVRDIARGSTGFSCRRSIKPLVFATTSVSLLSCVFVRTSLDSSAFPSWELLLRRWNCLLHTLWCEIALSMPSLRTLHYEWPTSSVLGRVLQWACS